MVKWSFLILMQLWSVGLSAQDIPSMLLPETLEDEALAEQQQLLLEEQEWDGIAIHWSRKTRDQLLQLPGMTSQCLAAIEQYEARFGEIIQWEELQAIPCIEADQLRLWRSLLVFSLYQSLPTGKKPKHQLLWRSRLITEKQVGYDPTRAEDGRSHYQGKAIQQLYRYQGQYRQYQWGLVYEKDAGEQQGHLSLALSGKRKKGGHWVIGDMRLGLGYGLVINTGFYAGKSSDPLLAIPQTAGLRAAASAAEWQRFRGIGWTMPIKKNWQWTLMLSYAKQHATISDSLFSQFYVSGLFRTPTEQNKWRQIQETTLAQQWQWQNKNWYFAWNMAFHHWDNPKVRGERADQLYDFAGRYQWLNSISWRKQWQHISLYGEMAIDQKLSPALIKGFLWPWHKQFGIQGSIRHYANNYHAQYANSLSARAQVQGETGILTGFWWDINRRWQFRGLYDFYQWPWLRYQIDHPSHGQSLQWILVHQPTKTQQWRISWRKQSGAKNSSGQGPLSELFVRQQIRLQWQQQVHSQVNLLLAYQRQGYNLQQGHAVWIQGKLKNESGRFKFNAQYSLFNTPDFNSRIYMPETGLTHQQLMPVLSGAGERWLLATEWKLGRYLTAGISLARTLAFDKDSMGSGLEETDKPYRTEIRWQLVVKK
jgi:hypothetical protein